MINILCVKWGDRYGPEYVNRLYKMVKKNTSYDHTFYCYTDDPTGIYPEIQIIPMPDDGLELWWPKLRMFEKGFGGLKGRCVFFDLDSVIQNSIDPIIEHKHTDLCKVKAFWKNGLVTGYEPGMRPKDAYNMDLNSSCLTWEADSLSHIWDYFWEDADWYMTKYSGIDRFLYHENITEKNHFPRGWFYSRHYGFKEGDEMIFKDWYYDPDYIVCMMNNFHRVDPELFKEYAPYDGMEHYWE